MPDMSRRAFMALTLAGLGSTLSACAGSGVSTSRKFKVGMELAYPPFETKDESGKPYGISPDFMAAFAKDAGYELEIENIAFDGLIPSLQTSKVDAIMSSITITPEREKVVDFSKPYAHAQLAILANAKSGVESWDTLNQSGKKVAVKTGSTGDVYATNHLTNAEVVRLGDESACVTEVVQGKADGFIYDQLTIYRNNKKHPNETKAIFIPDQEVENWGIAVAKGNTELLDQINAFIDMFKSEGGFEDLTQKYLAEEKKTFDELHFRWFFDEE